MTQLILRFLVGGIVVSLFATLADIVKPKSFAGLLGAAPSVALASLGLAIVTQGRAYAALESRSMTIGAIAFFFYSSASIRILAKGHLGATFVTVSTLALWFGCSLGIWFLLFRCLR
jgi:hypothetical protein